MHAGVRVSMAWGRGVFVEEDGAVVGVIGAGEGFHEVLTGGGGVSISWSVSMEGGGLGTKDSFRGREQEMRKDENI